MNDVQRCLINGMMADAELTAKKYRMALRELRYAMLTELGYDGSIRQVVEDIALVCGQDMREVAASVKDMMDEMMEVVA